MWAGIGMFIIVVSSVTIFVWFKPDNLAFDKEAHLVDRGKIPYGSDEGIVSPERMFSSKQEKT